MLFGKGCSTRLQLFGMPSMLAVILGLIAELGDPNYMKQTRCNERQEMTLY